MDIDGRVNRIIGQLNGVLRMVKAKRDCSEILQQISALKKAIDSLSKEIVISDVCKYVPKNKTKKFSQMMERVISL